MPTTAPVVEAFGPLLSPTEAAEPILSRPVRAALLEWLEEIWLKEELEKVALQPRRRALLSGPPGVGKTTLAHHMAARLGLPMLAARSDRIIDVWKGANTRNMGNLFQALEEHGSPILLFMDEFDTIACKRRVVTGSGGEHDNIGMVNVLLQRMDQYGGFIIAATNNAAEIDPAVWRRFEIQIALDLPGHEERERILARYLNPFILPRKALAALSAAFDTATPALIRQFCEGMKRQIVVGPHVGWSMQKEAVFERLIAAVQPHPDLGKPRLWSHGASDQSVRAMPWPLTTEPKPEQPEEPAGPTIIPMRRPS